MNSTLPVSPIHIRTRKLCVSRATEVTMGEEEIGLAMVAELSTQ